jgi:phage baseplate assembly protein W
MAFNVQQINPLDLRPSVGVGVRIPFTSPSVFATTYTTADATKTNLINYLLTNPGERYLNPTFGAGIRAFLFDQYTVDKDDEIQGRIRTGISTWFPNIDINNLRTQMDFTTGVFRVNLNFSIRNTGITDQLLINFEQ